MQLNIILIKIMDVKKRRAFLKINEVYRYLCKEENRDSVDDTSFSIILKRFFDFWLNEY